MTTRREVGPTLHLSGVPKGARPLQGRTAGFATRAMAGVVDVISVLAFIAVGLLLVNGFGLAGWSAGEPKMHSPQALPDWLLSVWQLSDER